MIIFLIYWFCIDVVTVIYIAAAGIADDTDDAIVAVVNSWMEDTS